MMTPEETETFANLKALFERTAEKHGEAAARRLFLKATAKPPMRLLQDHVTGAQWQPDDAA